jgi:hypothetical protein
VSVCAAVVQCVLAEQALAWLMPILSPVSFVASEAAVDLTSWVDFALAWPDFCYGCSLAYA